MCWGIQTNCGCMDMQTDDEGRELFNGAVPGFVERGNRFGKSIGYGSGTKIKRVNGLKGVHNVSMRSGGFSSGGCRSIDLKSQQDSGERLECISQSSRLDGVIHRSTTLTTFNAKVSESNG